MKTSIRAFVAATLAIGLNSSLSAAPVQGTPGPSDSTGTFEITLGITKQIIVTSLADLPLPSGVAGNPITGQEDICVGGIGFERYSIDLLSANGSSGGTGTEPYELAGVNDSLPYTVEFLDNIDNSGTRYTPAADGSIADTFLRTQTLSCTTENARIYVTVLATDWESASSESYADTLTVTVTAE
ncbi:MULTISPECIES: hypothetical protein [Microbulbifer]|uniref:hypothetical protein n=1 Tax=Microbulbifer TaxID=48073 RepID=UPI001143648A|nr:MULTISPECIES: hypothetical protein [Microbulbifer]